MTLHRILHSIGVGLLLFTFASCSGGEGQEPAASQQPPIPPPGVTPPAPPRSIDSSALPVGIWYGGTQFVDRAIIAVVRSDRETWFLFSLEDNPDWAGAVARGTMTTSGPTWKMENAVYLENGAHTRGTVDAQGTWVAKQRIQGEIVTTIEEPTPPPSPQLPDTIELMYHANLNEPINFGQAAGRYVGNLTPLERVEVDLAADGFITGRSAVGCTFSGQATPEGSFATITLTFNGPPCVNQTLAMKGVLTTNPIVGSLATMALSDNTQQVFIFIGQR